MMALEQATFGAGCFWMTQAVFRQVRGVKSVQAGYAGGTLSRPTDEQVTCGGTGHAQVVQVLFDASRVSYTELLEVFFAVLHAPFFANDLSTLASEGTVNSPYRAVIFYHDRVQKTAAHDMLKIMARQLERPLPVELSELSALVDTTEPMLFYPAAEAQQNYFQLNSQLAYCTDVIAPTVVRVRQLLSTKVSKQYDTLPNRDNIQRTYASMIKAVSAQ